MDIGKDNEYVNIGKTINLLNALPENSRMDYIITVNRKDYTDAMLPVMIPAAWIEMAASTDY